MCYDLARKMSTKAHVLQVWFILSLLLSCILWYVCVHVCICSPKQLSPSVASLHYYGYYCYYYYYYYLASGLSLNPELIISTSLVDQQTSETCLSPHSSAGVTDVYHHICLLCGYMGPEFRFTRLHGKHFTY